MVRILRSLLALALLVSMAAPGSFAQDTAKEEGFKFTDDILIPVTSVKDQNRSGTCWSFSGNGLLEAELLRMGKGEHDLSEMYIVRTNYHDKAESYVRYHGTVNFAGGGSFEDVLYTLGHYGLMPEEAYRGLNYGEDNHVHDELDRVLKGYLDALINGRVNKLTTAWLQGFDGILDAYLGKVPETFTVAGVSYTPQSYAKSLGLDAANYVSITSFSHHPFYQKFILEIPDNWRRATNWNVPLDELIAIIDNALKQGYSVAWGSDVSERGFKYNKGVALVPIKQGQEVSGSEKLKWSTLTEAERKRLLTEVNGPVPEQTITQELRQQAFDNWETTDDHGMLIMGIAHDQDGNKYYKVKNSWTSDGIYKGYFYASEAFVRYKTTNITVHKAALPKSIRKKLGL